MKKFLVYLKMNLIYRYDKNINTLYERKRKE